MALNLGEFLTASYEELALEPEPDLNAQVAQRLDQLYRLSDEIRCTGAATASRYSQVHTGIIMRFFNVATPAFDWGGSKGMDRKAIEGLPRDANYYRNVFELARVRARNAADTPEEYAAALLKYLDRFVATMEEDLKTAKTEIESVDDFVDALEILEAEALPPPLQMVHGLADDDATLLSIISTKI